MSDIHAMPDSLLTVDEKRRLRTALIKKFREVEDVTFEDTDRKILVVLGDEARWFSLGALGALASSLRMVRDHFAASLLSLLLMFGVVGAVGGGGDVVCGADGVSLSLPGAVTLRGQVSVKPSNANEL